MADVTSFVKAQSPLNLAPSGGESKKGASDKTSETKSFISIMLAQLSENQNSSKTDIKALQESLIASKSETKTIKASTKEAKSVDEHLLEDMLSLINALKAGTQATVLPTLKSSSRLEKIINNETAIKDFTEVKSMSDLMNLSKKYNLGLEKLTFTHEKIETLEKAFPQLTQSNFFNALKESMDTAPEVVLETKPVETIATLNPLEAKAISKDKTTEPASVLKELIAKEMVEKPKSDIKNESKADTKIENKSDIKPDAALMPSEIDEKPIVMEKSQKEGIVETNAKKTASLLHENAVQPVAKTLDDESKNSKKIKTETPALAKESDKAAEVEAKTASIATRTNEPKLENSTAKGLTEAILQTIKVEKPLAPLKPSQENANELMVNNTVLHDEIPTENVETKTNPNELKVEIKASSKQEANFKQPTISPRESLNQFANDLKEKIESYKPPVMKVELALNPRNLGEVDVTLLTRGNNLHVNITSNSSTMSLFTQNQAEFKNALVNMGFTNLEMNFSDQQRHEQHQNQSKNNAHHFEDLSEDALNDTLATVELVVPRYV